MEPVWNLGIAAAGFVKWKNSTEETLFAMTVIDKVEQQVCTTFIVYQVRKVLKMEGKCCISHQAF